MWSKGIDTKKRYEYLGMNIAVYTPTKHQQIEDEMIYRTYSKRQIDNLFKKVSDFEVAAIYDFAYDFETPVTVTSDTEDVVYILRKK